MLYSFINCNDKVLHYSVSDLRNVYPAALFLLLFQISEAFNSDW